MKAYGLVAIAKIYFSSDERVTAISYLGQALEAIHQIENEEDRLSPLRRSLFVTQSPHDGTVSPALLSAVMALE